MDSKKKTKSYLHDALIKINSKLGNAAYWKMAIEPCQLMYALRTLKEKGHGYVH